MLVYFVGLGIFLGLSLIGLVFFILKNRKAIDKEIAMSEPIELSSIKDDGENYSSLCCYYK